MNEEIEQAMASLKHLVECRCDEVYTGRGRHDPYSACDYADEVKIVSDHVAFIEAKLATCEKYRDAYAECDRIGAQSMADLEAKLARAEWLLTDAMVQLEEGKIKTRRNRARLILEFLNETKGENK